MKNFRFARFLVVVEQSSNFNYSTLPRITTSTDLARCLPSVRSRTTTLAALQDRITTRLSKYLPSEGGRFLIWLLDSDGNPILFVTGLLDVRQGKLNRQQLVEWSDALLPQITCEQVMTELEITASATAELTFTDGSDFETSDYEGDDDERDETIAEDMVEESCGHLEGSYMSYVERDEQYLYVNAEVTETVTVQVPWGHAKRLRPDQLEYLKVRADRELLEHIAADDVRLANVSVELKEASVRIA